MDERTDDRLDGRRDRFARLYIAYYGQILGYALRRAASADDALDATADTFLTLWRRLDEVAGPVLPWLYTVARNVLTNQQRGQRRYIRLTLRLAAQPGDGDAVAEPVAPDGPVAAAFARLRPEEQHLLELVAVGGLRPADIARIEGCTAARVRVRLHRARNRFAQELAGAGLPVQRRAAAGHMRVQPDSPPEVSR